VKTRCLPFDPVKKMFTTPSEATSPRRLTQEEEQVLREQEARIMGLSRAPNVTPVQHLNHYLVFKNW